MSFALKRVRRTDVRKGMVLVHKTEAPPKGEPMPLSRCQSSDVGLCSLWLPGRAQRYGSSRARC